jgi:hypothetical protein
MTLRSLTATEVFSRELLRNAGFQPARSSFAATEHGRLEGGGTLGPLDHRIAPHQQVHLCPQQTAERFGRLVHHRFVFR